MNKEILNTNEVPNLQMMLDSKLDWLSPKEVVENYNSFSISTLRRWRAENKNLPYTKVGKSIKYKRTDIEAFFNANMVEVA